jgi:secreted trypsin-like serine protease
MKKMILLTSLFLASFSFAKSSQSHLEIINGAPALDHAMASSVVGLFLKLSSPGSHLDGVWFQSCTGSVLSSKLILTAAHCVRNATPGTLRINFTGKTVTMAQQYNPATRIDVLKDFVTTQVKGIQMHPLYDGSGTHDLAVLALETEAPVTATPVNLLPEQFLNKEQNQTAFEALKLPVLLMGFGLTSEDPSVDTDVLRSTTVQAEFLKNLVVTDQTQGSGGCNGDSGGPAFLDLDGAFYQVGVTHGPHGTSQTCHETGEWVNPALDAEFLAEAAKKLNP